MPPCPMPEWRPPDDAANCPCTSAYGEEEETEDMGNYRFSFCCRFSPLVLTRQSGSQYLNATPITTLGMRSTTANGNRFSHDVTGTFFETDTRQPGRRHDSTQKANKRTTTDEADERVPRSEFLMLRWKVRTLK